MDLKAVQTAYRRYAPVYDFVFKNFFNQGHRLATKIVNEVVGYHGKVLEVGVGTGLSLPFYRQDLTVTGIDVSPEMLSKAHQKNSPPLVKANVTLMEMNAEQLVFDTNSYDCVMALYVASVVPDLQKFLNEITRVCKSGGHIIILNHFTSDNTIIKSIEKSLARFHKVCGFHSDFPIEPFLNHPALRLQKTYKTNFMGYWKLLHFVKP